MKFCQFIQKLFQELTGKHDTLRNKERRAKPIVDISDCLLYLQWKGVDWIHLGQDRYLLQILVKMVMKLSVHKRQGVS
jgi:hypothetical protein